MDKVCEGCGRHWSDPIPVNCPECGETFPVAETPQEPAEGYRDTTGSVAISQETGTYYCDRCEVAHNWNSGIGKRHMPVSGTP